MFRAPRAVPSLAERLLRPQRIGIFGHRGVGKTTLLSMLYREASAGRLTGCRLAAADAPTATYLAEKIQQLEAGQFLPGTLAETELHLNLYQGPSRIELVLKDYQGEHVELGREQPIQGFLRDCDAVWLCVDASALATDGLLRRQQEFEQLVESYLAREPGNRLDRPFAILVTKADLLGEPGQAEDALNMTRHALTTHCATSGLLAVSSLEVPADGPGFRLAPRNLDEPLSWLVASLMAQDEARLAQLWSTNDIQLLERCVACFARRYPAAWSLDSYQQRLRHLRRQRLQLRGLVGAAAAACVALSVWTYDALGYNQLTRFEEQNRNDPAAVLSEWESYQQWHPTRHLLKPEGEQAEKQHVRDLEQEAKQRAYTQRLTELRRDSEATEPDAEALWQSFVDFRKEFPDALQADWQPLQTKLQQQRDAARARKAKAAYAELLHAEHKSRDLPALVAKADQYLRDHVGSADERDVQRRRAQYLLRIDERDIGEARAYSRQHPFHFQTRLDTYQRYLDRHPGGGTFGKEAEAALKSIAGDWDRHDFRAIRDHFYEKPGDTANLVARCRSYLAAHPQGKFVTSATELLRWSERVTSEQEYRVTLESGHFEKKIARFFSLGPDLSVELEVNGVRYGPSTITVNKYHPEWNYEFPRPIRWKLGDSVRILVTDHDWKDRVVVTIEAEEGDRLGMRLLSGEVFSGANSLKFSSDFALPKLPTIE
jgi:hypothetical protein